MIMRTYAIFLVLCHVCWRTMATDAESTCVYTDTDGNYCNCDGSNKDCLVAEINWNECGDSASSIMTLVNQCIPSPNKDKRHVAYRQRCTNGDVSREWFHKSDCSGPVSKTEALSALVQPCAQIVCMAPDAETGIVNDAQSESSIAAPRKLAWSSLLTFILVSYFNFNFGF